MLQHIAHRLLISVPVLIGVLLVGFLMLQVVPTDPATVMAGPTASYAEIEAIRQSMGLNEPIIVQFGIYLSRVLQGDLGRSDDLQHRRRQRTRQHDRPDHRADAGEPDLGGPARRRASERWRRSGGAGCRTG